MCPAVTHTNGHVNTGTNHANTHTCICAHNQLMEGGRSQGAEMERVKKTNACLTIFTDVPFSPAGGCLVLLFLTQHQSEEGQREPVDRERTYTHSERIDTISTRRWRGHECPCLITTTQSNSEGSVRRVFSQSRGCPSKKLYLHFLFAFVCLCY